MALRVLNVVGGAMCAWVATARLALAPSTRLAATIVIAVAAPPILAGLAVGNPSVGSSGATLAGLLLWPASPLTAGVLLGVGLMAKPVTLPALAVFAGMRSRDGSSARFAALLAATATVLVSLAIPPWTLRDMLAANQAFGPCQAVGIDGALRAMGATSSPLMILVVVTGIAVAYARRRLMDTDDLIVVGTVASIVALPRIWSHSMTLVIPVVVWALEVQLRRYRSAPPEQPNARQKALLGLVLTGLGAALVCYPEQWAHLDELGIQPVWRGVVSLVPVAALLGLGWVVLGPGQSAPKATS